MNDDLSSIDGIGADLDRRYEHVSAEVPFAPVASILDFFGGGGRAAILDAITISMGNGDALVHVQGEPGSGKTMLANVLSERFAASHNIVRFERESFSVGELLHQLVIDLCPRQMSAPALESKERHRHWGASEIDAAKEAIIDRLAVSTPGDRPVLLLLDSAGTLQPPVQRLLNELCEVRRMGRRMLQAVVFERIDSEAFKASGSARIPEQSLSHHRLRRLTLAEIGQYLHNHMLVFDFNRRDVFSREMTYFVADRSEGVFRSINTIARNAFTIARLEGRNRPSMSHLLLAGLPQQEESEPHRGFVMRHRKAVFALLGSTVVASAATLVLLSSS